jgi:hypothetical protein
MSAPGQAHVIQAVKVRSEQGLTTYSELSPACREATICMKPGGGRYQAATQVKGWSPENTIVTEADTVHFGGRQHRDDR